MLKKIFTILAGTALSLTVGANVQASNITVEKGDTLWDLSRENNTSVKNIKMVNQLSTDLIHPGDILNVAAPKQYTVKQADTLWDIAREYQVTVSQIQEWNQLHTDLIHPGLNLVIFEGAKTVATAKPAKTAKPTQTTAAVVKEKTNTVTTPEKQTKSTPVKPATVTPKESSKTEESKKETNKVEEPKKENNQTTSTEVNAKEITVTATAYTATCDGCSGITSTGINLLENPNAKVISVDPSVIPLGSKVHVEGYGEAIAGDTGGAIKGKKIDVFIPNKQDAINFGVKEVKVTILD